VVEPESRVRLLAYLWVLVVQSAQEQRVVFAFQAEPPVWLVA
jgi:hypothetical protein